MGGRHGVCVAVIVAAMMAGSASARAQRCPTPTGSQPSLGSVDAAARLAYITRVLNRAHHNAYLFNNVWAGIFAFGAVGSFGLAYFIDNKELSTAQYVSGGKAVIATASVFALPLRIRRVRVDDLRSDLRGHPRNVCARLVDAEANLAWSAAREKKKKGFAEFARGLVLNAAGFSVVGFGYGYWREAIGSSLFGTVVGLVRMSSAPKTARRGLRRYKAGKLGVSAHAHTAWAIQPWVGRGGTGMTFALVW